MKLKAMGKINLALDVVRKREDGYHEVRMIMQTVNLYDQLELRETREKGIRLWTNLPYLPVNENNLVYRGAKLLMEEFHVNAGWRSACRREFRWRQAWPGEVLTRRRRWWGSTRSSAWGFPESS